MTDIAQPMRARQISELLPAEESTRLDAMDGRTIYIVGIEPVESAKYGDGYLVDWVDSPGEKDVHTSAVYGMYPKEQLRKLHALTLEGTEINADSPIQATIKRVGRTYKFT